MEVTGENVKYIFEAIKVDFLTERWEKEMYAIALIQADEWGKKIDKQNLEYRKRNRLIDRYNV